MNKETIKGGQALGDPNAENQAQGTRGIGTSGPTSIPIPPYRPIRTHVVNPTNDLLRLRVEDVPGPGGAPHNYLIEFDRGMNHHRIAIPFQNGPITENGVNGVTQEVLLAIVADRLEAFQAGEYACPENAEALRHVQAAQEALLSRTRARMDRGVEGTSQK